MNRTRLSRWIPASPHVLRLGLLLALLLACNPGCELPSAKPVLKLVPVSGKVTLDDDPVGGAKVVFLPEVLFGTDGQPLPCSSGLTDDSGNFQLQTEGQPGAPAGNYRVLISKRETSSEEEPEELSDAELARRLAAIIPGRESEAWMMAELIPTFYNLQTRLRFSVPPSGTKSADFSLSIFERPLVPDSDSSK